MGVSIYNLNYEIVGIMGKMFITKTGNFLFHKISWFGETNISLYL